MTISRLSSNTVANVVNLPWAKVSGGTTSTYTNSNGWLMSVHSFATDGTLTVSEPGCAEVLLCGGGGSGWSTSAYGPGGGGSVIDGIRILPAGSHAITIGQSGVGAGGIGGATKLGTLFEAMGGGGGRSTDTQEGYGLSGGSPGVVGAGAGGQQGSAGAKQQGYTSSITGSPVVYGRGGGVASTAVGIGCGGGGNNGTYGGTAGIVIVAVRIG